MELRNRLRGLHGLLTRNKLHAALRNIQQGLAFAELRHAVGNFARPVVHAATAIERIDVLAGILRPDSAHVDNRLLVFLHEIRAELVDVFFLDNREFLIIRDDLEVVLPVFDTAIHIMVVHEFFEHRTRARKNLDTLRNLFKFHFRITAPYLEADFVLSGAEPAKISGYRKLREQHHLGTRLLGAGDHALHLLDIFFRIPRNHIHLRYIDLHGRPLINSIQI